MVTATAPKVPHWKGVTVIIRIVKAQCSILRVFQVSPDVCVRGHDYDLTLHVPNYKT